MAETNICDNPKVKVAMAQQITDIVRAKLPGFEVVDMTNVTTRSSSKGNFTCHVTIEDNEGEQTSGTYREYTSKMDPDSSIAEFAPD
jgi:putative lipoic acid-binding regulatory protein